VVLYQVPPMFLFTFICLSRAVRFPMYLLDKKFFNSP
jgi:hypothetical protein